jgi:high-affinity iron transporter
VHFSSVIMLYLTVLCLNLAACGQSADKMDPAQMKRLTEIRENLQKELGDAYQIPVQPASESQLQRGEQLYDQLCASCHGLSGQGLIHGGNDNIWKPADFTDGRQAGFFSDRARLQIIANGIKGTPMLGWGKILSEEDVLAVFQFIKSLNEG